MVIQSRTNDFSSGLSSSEATLLGDRAFFDPFSGLELRCRVRSALSVGEFVSARNDANAMLPCSCSGLI